MQMSVYLHDEICAVLKCFGTLDEVTNRILDSASEGIFDVENKPQVVERSGAKRYNIDVRNEDYLELYRIRRNSPSISLRRLLYWFVENEMYDYLAWEVKSKYRDPTYEKRNKLIRKIRQDLEKLSTLVGGNGYDIAVQAKELILSLEEEDG